MGSRRQSLQVNVAITCRQTHLDCQISTNQTRWARIFWPAVLSTTLMPCSLLSTTVDESVPGVWMMLNDILSRSDTDNEVRSLVYAKNHGQSFNHITMPTPPKSKRFGRDAQSINMQACVRMQSVIIHVNQSHLESKAKQSENKPTTQIPLLLLSECENDGQTSAAELMRSRKQNAAVRAKQEGPSIHPSKKKNRRERKGKERKGKQKLHPPPVPQTSHPISPHP
ncbi:hypothetical protein HDK90DRAFT_336146 [Phyllosticta capitalensis]|uniref:Uncharacterized protein n=1 Tax=Phyllosticta capitalensis TaxID=121624 RepID=A0ABR1YJ43_9PEZI